MSARKGNTNQHIVSSTAPPAVATPSDSSTVSIRRSANPIIANNDDIDLASQPASVLNYGARINISSVSSVRTTSSVVYIVEFSESVSGIIPSEVTLLNGTNNTGITPTIATANSGATRIFTFANPSTILPTTLN